MNNTVSHFWRAMSGSVGNGPYSGGSTSELVKRIRFESQIRIFFAIATSSILHTGAAQYDSKKHL